MQFCFVISKFISRCIFWRDFPYFVNDCALSSHGFRPRLCQQIILLPSLQCVLTLSQYLYLDYFAVTIRSHPLAGGKLVDVHLESVLESHVDVVGLPAVHRVPQQRDEGRRGEKFPDFAVVPHADDGMIDKKDCSRKETCERQKCCIPMMPRVGC